ncbi:MAG: hypothetical protein CFH10_00389 [Alphaproteobacteria bacterium MarineAlpha4_Bin2]|nr:MAG: hypothetical protein CFH10_00389 [Alphaproteobacteria bacterium MarineAlpha4_Bin2]
MIKLENFGSFHVGGRSLRLSGQPVETIQFTGTTNFENDPNGDYQIEQAYVQYFIPEEKKYNLPVLLVHGGGMTGSNWETTPDGRPGWLHRFLEMGFATYVIDNVERGRSGWCALPGQWEGLAVMRSLQQAWVLFRFGTLANFPALKTFDGMQFPSEALENFARQFVPRWTTTTDIMRAGLLAALERIGPCIVICHSQGGDLSLDLIAQHPELVRHAVALEPSGFPDIARVKAPMDQHWLFVMGDFIEANPFWANLMDQTKATVARLNAIGADAKLMHLPKEGVPGNSHMMMMDKNSNEVFNRVHGWLTDRI